MVDMDSPILGQKANNLAILAKIFPALVPPFVVVAPKDFYLNWKKNCTLLNDFANKYLSKKLSQAEFQQKLAQTTNSLKVNVDYLEQLKTKLQEMGFENVSFRTSAAQEDLEGSSFAGQYTTFLEQDLETSTLKKNVLACVTSLFSPRVLDYIQELGDNKLQQDGSVIIQQMFYGKASGVLFTENGRNEMQLSYTFSWRNVTVEGDPTHSFTIDKAKLAQAKQLPTDLPQTISQVIDAALLLEQQEGKPLDLEWSVSKTKAVLLQFRPITKHTAAYYLEWDNSNIIESYPGITLPLTYTFIRELYAKVYPEFLKLLGHSERFLAQKKHIFDNMLGYLHGRVYYNINNWYELIKMLPGYKYNKEFFEAMLMPAKKKTPSTSYKKKRTPRETFGLGVAALRFMWLLLQTDKLGARFSQKYATRYKVYKATLWEYLSAEEIIKTFNQIERDLLQQWAVPILNDFRTMVFHGLLRKLFFPQENDKNYTQLLSNIYDHTSIEPVRQLSFLAKDVKDLLEEYPGTEEEFLSAIENNPEFNEIRERIQQYMVEYGGRSPDELKLENPRLAESFSDFTAFLLTRAKGFNNKVLSQKKPNSEAAIIQKMLARDSFFLKIIKSFIFRFVLHNTKKGISQRERFRFYRAQVFGIARRTYLALGNRFTQAGVLQTRDDIFWLTRSEVNNLILGHAFDLSIKDIVVKRKKLYDSYAKEQLARRVISSGLVAATEVETDTSIESNGKKKLVGLGVSKGRFAGKTIVLRKFDPTAKVAGKVLVTEHTDPGWTLLFLNTSALLVERGNALSHASIVARELGIPAVVGIDRVCSKLENNQKVLVNGNTGEVTIL